MRIGTTPTHIFTLPFSTELVRSVEITYCQNGQVILQKDERDCTMCGKKVSVTLSQEDTFVFTGSVNVEIQIRVMDDSGNVYASGIMCVSCQRCLSDEVIV